MDLLAETVVKTFKIEDEEVVIRKFSPEDSRALEVIKDDTDRGIEGIIRSVVRWSFCHTSGQPMAISKDIISRLRVDVVNFLALRIAEFNSPKNLETEEVINDG